MVRKRFSTKEITLALLAVLTVIGFLTFYIWHQAESIRLGYKTRDLEHRIQILKKEVETLEAKKTSLLSLHRVERIATTKLTLVEPSEDQLIHIPTDQEP